MNNATEDTRYVIQVDYMFLRLGPDDQPLTVLTAMDVVRGIGGATVVQNKGLSDGHPAKWLKHFVENLGYNRTCLQSDSENAVKAVVNKAAETLADCTTRVTEVHDHKANGAVERWHRTLQEQIRAISIQLKTDCGIEVKAKDKVIEWIVRHAGWALHHYHGIRGGQTGYYLLNGRTYDGTVVNFGEKVMYHKPVDTSGGNPLRAPSSRQDGQAAFGWESS